MELITNRVLNTWRNWEERQAEIDKAIGNTKDHKIAVQQLQLEYFKQSRFMLTRNLTNYEQPFLPLIDTAIRKLENLVYPNLIQRLFFRLKHQFINAPAYARRIDTERNENMESLRSGLLKAGFGDFAGKLEHHLSFDRKKHTINLSSQIEGEKNLSVSLHFEKDVQECFHFRAIDATIQNNSAGGPFPSFRFELEEWPGLDAQQVRNLLEGRPVRQHFTDIGGQPKSQWLELAPRQSTVKRYNENYHYDLDKIIDQLPLSGANPATDKNSLIEKLEHGHQVTAVWSHAGTNEPVDLQADPAGCSVRIRTSAKQEVTREQLEQQINSRQVKKQATIKRLTQNPADQKIDNKRKQAARL